MFTLDDYFAEEDPFNKLIKKAIGLKPPIGDPNFSFSKPKVEKPIVSAAPKVDATPGAPAPVKETEAEPAKPPAEKIKKPRNQKGRKPKSEPALMVPVNKQEPDQTYSDVNWYENYHADDNSPEEPQKESSLPESQTSEKKSSGIKPKGSKIFKLDPSFVDPISKRTGIHADVLRNSTSVVDLSNGNNRQYKSAVDSYFERGHKKIKNSAWSDKKIKDYATYLLNKPEGAKYEISYLMEAPDGQIIKRVGSYIGIDMVNGLALVNQEGTRQYDKSASEIGVVPLSSIDKIKDESAEKDNKQEETGPVSLPEEALNHISDEAEDHGLTLVGTDDNGNVTLRGGKSGKEYTVDPKRLRDPEYLNSIAENENTTHFLFSLPKEDREAANNFLNFDLPRIRKENKGKVPTDLLRIEFNLLHGKDIPESIDKIKRLSQNESINKTSFNPSMHLADYVEEFGSDRIDDRSLTNAERSFKNSPKDFASPELVKIQGNLINKLQMEAEPYDNNPLVRRIIEDLNIVHHDTQGHDMRNAIDFYSKALEHTLKGLTKGKYKANTDIHIPNDRELRIHSLLSEYSRVLKRVPTELPTLEAMLGKVRNIVDNGVEDEKQLKWVEDALNQVHDEVIQGADSPVYQLDVYSNFLKQNTTKRTKLYGAVEMINKEVRDGDLTPQEAISELKEIKDHYKVKGEPEMPHVENSVVDILSNLKEKVEREKHEDRVAGNLKSRDDFFAAAKNFYNQIMTNKKLIEAVQKRTQDSSIAERQIKQIVGEMNPIVSNYNDLIKIMNERGMSNLFPNFDPDTLKESESALYTEEVSPLAKQIKELREDLETYHGISEENPNDDNVKHKIFSIAKKLEAAKSRLKHIYTNSNAEIPDDIEVLIKEPLQNNEATPVANNQNQQDKEEQKRRAVVLNDSLHEKKRVLDSLDVETRDISNQIKEVMAKRGDGQNVDSELSKLRSKMALYEAEKQKTSHDISTIEENLSKVKDYLSADQEDKNELISRANDYKEKIEDLIHEVNQHSTDPAFAKRVNQHREELSRLIPQYNEVSEKLAANGHKGLPMFDPEHLKKVIDPAVSSEIESIRGKIKQSEDEIKVLTYDLEKIENSKNSRNDRSDEANEIKGKIRELIAQRENDISEALELAKRSDFPLDERDYHEYSVDDIGNKVKSNPRKIPDKKLEKMPDAELKNNFTNNENKLKQLHKQIKVISSSDLLSSEQKEIIVSNLRKQFDELSLKDKEYREELETRGLPIDIKAIEPDFLESKIASSEEKHKKLNNEIAGKIESGWSRVYQHAVDTLEANRNHFLHNAKLFSPEAREEIKQLNKEIQDRLDNHDLSPIDVDKWSQSARFLAVAFNRYIHHVGNVLENNDVASRIRDNGIAKSIEREKQFSNLYVSMKNAFYDGNNKELIKSVTRKVYPFVDMVIDSIFEFKGIPSEILSEWSDRFVKACIASVVEEGNFDVIEVNHLYKFNLDNNVVKAICQEFVDISTNLSISSKQDGTVLTTTLEKSSSKLVNVRPRFNDEKGIDIKESKLKPVYDLEKVSKGDMYEKLLELEEKMHKAKFYPNRSSKNRIKKFVIDNDLETIVLFYNSNVKQLNRRLVSYQNYIASKEYKSESDSKNSLDKLNSKEGDMSDWYENTDDLIASYYFVHDEDDQYVYYPSDTEAPILGVPYGYGYVRQLAAYHLDKLFGFDIVFPIIEKNMGNVVGALEHRHGQTTTLLEKTKGKFKIDNEEVLHKIAILDFILGNRNRHAGNVVIGDDDSIHIIDNYDCLHSSLLKHVDTVNSCAYNLVSGKTINKKVYQELSSVQAEHLHDVLCKYVGKQEAKASLERFNHLVEKKEFISY